MKKCIIASYIILFICLIANAQSGSLDNTFGTNGKVTTAFGNSNDYGYAVAMQNDGKIVVAGCNSNNTKENFALVRYNNDGNLDDTFGMSGEVTTDFGSGNADCRTVAIQNDGKILTGGYSDNGTNEDFALVRFNSNGILDSTFDSDGKVTTALSSSDDAAYSMAIQNDGKIVLVGTTNNGINHDFALVRYNNDGSLDNNFGSGGKVTTDIGSADDFCYSVALQSNGKIVVAGFTNNGTNWDFALVCYTSNGNLDSNFGSGGKVITAVGSGDDSGRSLVIQSDGKILVSGYSYNGVDYSFALIRYNSNGTLDDTFGIQGKVITSIGNSNDCGNSVAIQNDGKIVVAGYTNNGGTDNDFALVRYLSDGTLDNTFGSDGKIATSIGSSHDVGVSMVIQTDNKIVVVGFSNNGTNYDFAIVRYNSVVTGIEKFNNNPFKVEIYPNPTNGKMKLMLGNWDLISGIEIYNTLGERVCSSTYSPQSNKVNAMEDIDISNSPKGLYFVKFLLVGAEGNGKKVCSIKVILQ